MKDQLVTRNTALKAKRGFKKVFVFGILTVPKDSAMGGNAVYDVECSGTGSLYGTLDLMWRKVLSKKFATRSVQDTAEELWNVHGREQTFVDVADRALKLISQGDRSPEIYELAKKLRAYEVNMAPLDVMRQVVKSIITSIESKEQ